MQQEVVSKPQLHDTATFMPIGAWPVMAPALAGVIFCLLNAAGADLLCLNSGCGIYSSYSLGGISINLLGAIGFAVILVLAFLAGQRPHYRRWLFAVLLAGLFIDTLFLLWQILFWPCSSCLVVALLLATCVLAALWVFPGYRRRLVYLALVLWFGSFAAVGLAAGKELLVDPWSMQGEIDAPVLVYFSPTCPACEKTVLEILAHPDLANQVAFLPIAKNDEDLRRLTHALANAEKGGVAALFEKVEEVAPDPTWSLRWRLARNKMSLARLGVDTVPLVLTPQLVQIAPEPPAFFNYPFGSPLELLGIPQLQHGCSTTALDKESCED